MRAPNRAGESNAVNSNFNVGAANDILSNGADRIGPVKNRSAVIANAFMVIFLPPLMYSLRNKMAAAVVKDAAADIGTAPISKYQCILSKPLRIEGFIYSKL